MNNEIKKDVLENLSYAAKDFIRDAKLHNEPGHDWDSMTEELTNFLFAKAEVWLSDKATEVEAAKIAEYEAIMADYTSLDDLSLLGVI